jgi:SAM-dependent methyltransferase
LVVKPSVERLLNRYYPYSATGGRFRDGTKPFYDWILSSIDAPAAEVLDIGAGPGVEPHRLLRGKVRRLVGVDIDPVVLTNACVDEAHVMDGIHLPFDEGRFDAVYSDWTVEHLENPPALLSEIRRVLKPSGSFWFRTNNLRHYVTLVSAHTPHWFHELVANRVRGLPQNCHEQYRVYYRMNTPGAVRRHAQAAGFDECEVRLIESFPSYLVFNPLAFRVGVAYERFVNRYSSVSPLRLILLARTTKLAAGQPEKTAVTPSAALVAD